MARRRDRRRAARALSALVGLVVIAAAGCSSNHAYYTLTTLQEYSLNPDTLRNVQFYLDKPVTLQFSKRTSASAVHEHGVENIQERFERHIEIVEKAGGEAIGVGEGWIQIQVAHDLTLEFRPDPKSRYGMYYLQSINEQPVENDGTIHFRGNYYKVIFGTVGPDRTVKLLGRPRLLYEVSSVERYRREREEITGIWLKDRAKERQTQEALQTASGSAGGK
jgi:hypothetical protein